MVNSRRVPVQPSTTQQEVQELRSIYRKAFIVGCLYGLLVGFVGLGNLWVTIEHNNASMVVSELLKGYIEDHRGEKCNELE